jgi:hypothetical protein
VRFVRMTALVAAGMLALAGCGGDEGGSGGSGGDSEKVNTFEGQSATQVLDAAKKAAQDAKSVHMTGEFNEGGSALKIDMLLSDSQGGQGTVSIDGDEMALRQIGEDIWVKGSKEVWATMVPGAVDAAEKLDGKWVHVSKNDTASKQFAEITSMDQAFEGLLKASGKQITKVKGKDVAGTPTIGLEDKGDTEDDTATLYIATKGPAYPLLVEPKTQKGKITFSEWNSDVKVEAPEGATELSKLVKS